MINNIVELGSDRKPTPTEFLGVVYRSRSEAIVAAAFNMTEIKWEYEPSHARVGDWVPDFFIQGPKEKLTRRHGLGQRA
jgi:hypothetical protein